MGKRENGGGTIRTVRGANGIRYYAYAPARYDIQEDGTTKCIRMPLGSYARKTDAKAALTEYQHNPVSGYRKTLAEVYSEWSQQIYKDIGKSTRDGYSAAWKQMQYASPSVLQKPMRDITTAELRGILDYWLEDHDVVYEVGGKLKRKTIQPLSKSSMQKIRCVMTQCYKYACANRIYDQNIASYVKIPKDAPEGKARSFTEEEIQTVLDKWETTPGGDAILLLMYTGFRVSEFLQLTADNYNKDSNTLTGGIKTDAGRNRVVPVHPRIQPVVEALLRRGGDTIYCKPNGRAYTSNWFRTSVWHPAIEHMGLPDELTPHCARHTFATRLSSVNARPEDIQKLMGHTDFALTANVYINQDIDALRESVLLLD